MIHSTSYWFPNVSFQFAKSTYWDLRATSHTSQEPWPWDGESPNVSVSRHLQNHIVWTRILKCSVKPLVTGPSTKCCFSEILFMRVLTCDKIESNKQINGCERSECHALPVLCKTYLQVVVFENSPCDHGTWSVWCHVGIHVDLASILHSHTPSVPRA